MSGFGPIYLLAGLVHGAFALLGARDRGNPKRLNNALFWGLFAASFLLGDVLGDFGNGVLALALVAVAASGLGIGTPKTTSPQARRDGALRYGNLLFVPALVIPAITLIGSSALKGRLFGAAEATMMSLGLAVLVAVALAKAMFRQPVLGALQEGRRLMDAIGWAALLPQMLAALGAGFATAGVGGIVGGLAVQMIPGASPLAAVIAYTVGMALFTAIMGNAFAAFPVMTAGIGLPLIVMKFGGDPAIMAAIGMLSGFCGTLTTPMAANFNLVPVALLNIPDRYAVIKAQLPTALILLAVNTGLMYALVF